MMSSPLARFQTRKSIPDTHIFFLVPYTEPWHKGIGFLIRP